MATQPRVASNRVLVLVAIDGLLVTGSGGLRKSVCQFGAIVFTQGFCLSPTWGRSTTKPWTCLSAATGYLLAHPIFHPEAHPPSAPLMKG